LFEFCQTEQKSAKLKPAKELALPTLSEQIKALNANTLHKTLGFSSYSSFLPRIKFGIT